jgi:hypothetical protein
MKTFDECLDEAENKYSRKTSSGLHIDTLYPILKQIVKEGVKEWLTQNLDPNDNDDEFIEVINNFVKKSLEELVK